MYQAKSFILNHRVAVVVALVIFTPLVTVVFGAIGLLLSAVSTVLGFILGMLNATGVAIILLAGLGYAGKRIWEYGNTSNEDTNTEGDWLK
jgi:hypothetical protein